MLARLLGILTILLTSCASTPADRPLLVQATLIDFAESANWSHYSDGSYEAHHATTFQVLAPAELCGAKLVVLHAEIPDDSSAWRRVGASYELSLAPERAAALRREASGDQSSQEFFGTTWVTIQRELGTAPPACDPG